MAARDFLYVEVIGERALTRNLDQMPDIVRAILLEKTRVWTDELADKVRDYISERLNQKSGKLEQGVQVEIIEDGLVVDGRVYIAGVPHARVQEEGAVVPPHMILPRNGKVMAFLAATGNKVFATRVQHPGGVIPGAHFMKDAYGEMAPKISRGIKTAVVEGIRKNMRRR